jgi:hypothetical protein
MSTFDPARLPRERRYDLDWVRIAAFLLLIVYHVGMYYVSWDWHVKSPNASPAAEPFMLLSSPWRLTLLFVVSGAATGFLLDRRGDSFLGARTKRLLVPLVFGMVFVVPPQPYFEVVEKVQYAGSYLDFMRLYVAAYPGFCRGDDCLTLPTWNHLWFVAYLWVYTVVLYAAWRYAPRALAAASARSSTLLGGWRVLWVPIVVLVLARVLLGGRFPATHALVDDWYNHVTYLFAFFVGYAVVRGAGFRTDVEHARWAALAVALGAWLCLVGTGFYGDEYGYGDVLIGVRRLAFGTMQWSAIVAVLGFAHRHWNVDHPARHYLTQAVFPVYIAHQTLIVLAAVALRPLNLPPAAEAPLLIAITLAGSFAVYETVRRVGALRPLFGLGPREPVRALPAAAAARV